MKANEHPQLAPADPATVKCVEIECYLDDDRDVLDFIESDRDFKEFVESISVTEEQLAALMSTPDLSIPELRLRSR